MSLDPTNPTGPALYDCGVCGQPPDECYHLCSNSRHYYSAEQERMDEPFYGDDDVSERYMEHCSRHGAYAGDCGGCEAEHIERESDIPVDVEDFAPQAANWTFEDDLPF